jgi:lipoate---protein ligase
MDPNPRWVMERWRGSAAVLHARPMPSDGLRRLSVMEITRPAMVLGSAQRDDVLASTDADESGIDVVRRRSGGGAVWLDPGNSVWIDVFVPRDDVLWSDDIGRAFRWVGEAVAASLRGLGVAARVHPGGFSSSGVGRMVCFASRGSGEVLVGDRKLVGISQRRTRFGSRFQLVWYRLWNPVPWLDLFNEGIWVQGPWSQVEADVLATGIGLQELHGSRAATPQVLDEVIAGLLRA